MQSYEKPSLLETERANNLFQEIVLLGRRLHIIPFLAPAVFGSHPVQNTTRSGVCQSFFTDAAELLLQKLDRVELNARAHGRSNGNALQESALNCCGSCFYDSINKRLEVFC